MTIPKDNTDAVSETRFSLLEQEVGGIKNDLNEFRTEVRAYFSRSSLRSMWPMILGVGGMLWFVLNMQINNSTKTVDDKANQALLLAQNNTQSIGKMLEVQSTVVQQNATSVQDRADQKAITGKLSELTAKLVEGLSTETAHRRAKNAEIETQFRAFEGYANLTRVWENRMFGLLWEKVYGQRFPEFQYYPRISIDGQPSELQ